MSRRQHVQQPQRGFTLLELMVVLVIVGVMISVTTLAFRGPSGVDALETEGRRLAALIDIAAQESILQNRELALDIDTHGYEFLQMVTDEEGKSQFVALDEDELLHPRELPEQIELSALIEGEEMQSLFYGGEQSARVFILSSGEMSPFEITLQLDDGPLMRIIGNMMGVIGQEGPIEGGL